AVGEHAHEAAVRELVQRVLDDRPLQGLNRAGRVSARGEQLAELDEQGELRLAQRLPPRRGPLLVAVLRQQLPGIQLERRRLQRGRLLLARENCRALEAPDA